MPRCPVLPFAVLAVALCAVSQSASAQVPFIPPEFYNSIRPDFGSRLPLCILPNSATAETDRQMAHEIAELLLLEPAPVEMEIDIDMLDESGIFPIIFTHLAEVCVGVMGVQIIPGEMQPDWMSLSRPYLDEPYVLLTNDESIAAFADLPSGTRLGLPLYTPIDTEVMAGIAAGAFDVRRLPYDTPALMAQLMAQGELDAAVVWYPHLSSGAISSADFYSTRASVAPLRQSSRAVSVLMRSQDQLLRTLVDDAIAIITDARF